MFSKGRSWEVNRIDELKIVYQGQDVEQTARRCCRRRASSCSPARE